MFHGGCGYKYKRKIIFWENNIEYLHILMQKIAFK